jgi:hypothetical protein
MAGWRDLLTLTFVIGITSTDKREGCFSCCFLSTSNAYRIRDIVTQKDEENFPILVSTPLLWRAQQLVIKYYLILIKRSLKEKASKINTY